MCLELNFSSIMPRSIGGVLARPIQERSRPGIGSDLLIADLRMFAVGDRSHTQVLQADAQARQESRE